MIFYLLIIYIPHNIDGSRMNVAFHKNFTAVQIVTSFLLINAQKMSVNQIHGVKNNKIPKINITITTSVESEPKLGLAQLSFGSSFWGKKLGLACHAFQKAWLGSARHILQKKLGSARLALLFKKTSYLEKQKMS